MSALDMFFNSDERLAVITKALTELAKYADSDELAELAWRMRCDLEQIIRQEGEGQLISQLPASLQVVYTSYAAQQHIRVTYVMEIKCSATCSRYSTLVYTIV